MTDRYLSTRRAGSSQPGRLKMQWEGAGKPTVDDDSTQGYQLASLWWDATNRRLYFCADAAAGTAEWVAIGAGVSVGVFWATVRRLEQEIEEAEAAGTSSGARAVIMRSGISFPPEPVVTSDGKGWVYSSETF